MYKALNYWVYGGFSGEKTAYEFIDYAAEKGLDGVELTVGDCLPVDLDDAECAKIKAYAAAKKVGLRTLACGGGWGLAIGTDDEAERQQALEFCRKYLKLAAKLGAESILVVPGATRVAWEPNHPVKSYKVVWEMTQRSVKELLPLAEELKVNIALENVWNRFLLSPMEWKLFLDSFGSERVGIYFDTGNCLIYGRAQDYVEILGSHIKAIHLKNFKETDCAGGLHGFGDDMLDGELDFAALFAALKAMDYQGPVTVEMIPFSRLPDLVLPDAELADKTVEKLLSL